MTIERYIKKYGKFDFESLPFNEVDALILSQLVYFGFDGLLAELDCFDYTLEDFFNKDYSYVCVKHVWEPARNHYLAKCLSKSKRFKQVSIGFFTNRISNELESQFAGCVFKILSNTYVVTYRGTDASIIGWKEDLNLGFLSEIPSQIKALEFLERFSKKYSGTYIISGHSKGGNLAIYASSKFSNPDLIKQVYCFDGPGFLKGFYKQQSYKNIKSKIVKIVPKTAFVGLLLEGTTNYKVVSSYAVSIFQHNLLTWEVDKTHLKYTNIYEKNSRHSREQIAEWASKMDVETRRVFVDTMYELVQTLHIDRVSQFIKKWPIYVIKLNNELKEKDPLIQATVKKVFKELLENYKNQILK